MRLISGWEIRVFGFVEAQRISTWCPARIEYFGRPPIELNPAVNQDIRMSLPAFALSPQAVSTDISHNQSAKFNL